MENTTSWTRNEDFDRDGYLIVKDLYNPQELYREVPVVRGLIRYFGYQLHEFTCEPVDSQVEGALVTYNHPQYRKIHSKIRIKLEKLLGRKLYNTHYCDRFYFPEQELKPHLDRDACEISVSIHSGSNTNKPWAFCIKTPMGEDRFCYLEPGDAVIYKGCELEHWRDPLPPNEYKPSLLDGIRRKEFDDDTYHHQVFFHYVLQDGTKAQFAWDRIN